jgi:chaperonin cofactor prefoldin
MTDETVNTPNPEQASDQPTQTLEDSWKEVGKQFEALGQGIAQAFRAAVNSGQAREMKGSLESMMHDISKAIEDASATPEGHKLREETNRTVDTLRAAGEHTVREARPHVISALKQLNDELQKLVNKIEQG